MASPVGMTDYSVGRKPYAFYVYHKRCPCKGRIIHCKRLKSAPLTISFSLSSNTHTRTGNGDNRGGRSTDV